MIVVIHQPEYLPWLGFFDKLLKSDLFVVLDNVQFQRGFINRNRIKTPEGKQWLTVPIVHKFHRSKISDVKIDNQTDWQKDNWQGLVHNYNKAPYFTEYSDFLKEAFGQKWEKIVDLDLLLIRSLMEKLKIKTPVNLASALKVNGNGSELLINICKTVGADTYLSGEGGKLYMDLSKFKEAGIKVMFQEFSHPEYPQQFPGNGFLPNMSIVDLLFNCGEKSINIIKNPK